MAQAGPLVIKTGDVIQRQYALNGSIAHCMDQYPIVGSDQPHAF